MRKNFAARNFGRFNMVAFVAVAALMVFGLAGTVMAQCVVADGGVQTQTLFAGQTIDAGSVSVEVDGDDLVVTYNTTGDWELTETHLWVGSSIADMPQTRKGTPKIGNFPYASGNITGETSYTEFISLADLGFTCPGDDTTYFVAAHAAVQLVDDAGNVIQTETGWADGDRFVEKGMWGTFFDIALTCECGVAPPPSGETCETAFAYGGSTANTCFLDIDEDGDSAGDFNRWGWTNGPLGAGSYTFDIYAGAGRCDTDKGTLVGTLTVNYDGTTATVKYETSSGFGMNEVHVYVGNEILARDVNGDFTVAPGQYPVVDDLDDGTTTHVSNWSVSGDIYVVAHAVVCGDYQ